MDHFRHFSPSVLRMLDKTPEDSVKLWDLLDMDLQPSLIKDKAVLIGDAAHPFLPRKISPASSLLLSSSSSSFVSSSFVFFSFSFCPLLPHHKGPGNKC